MRGQADVLGGAFAQNAGDLRFDTENDALNYAKELVQRGNQWAVAQGMVPPGQDYLEAKNEIILDVKFTSGRQPRNFKLITKVIPLVNEKIQPPPSEGDCFAERGGIFQRSAHNSLMSVSSKTRECPQNRIASIVRLERETEGYEGRVYVRALPFDLPFEVIWIFSEGEIDALGVGSPQEDCGIAKRLIERGSKFFDYVGGKGADSRGKSVLELDFNNLLSGLRIEVSDKFVVARLANRLAQRFQIGEPFFSALD